MPLVNATNFREAVRDQWSALIRAWQQQATAPPQDLIELEAQPPEFPTDAQIETLFEVAFKASFRSEELRRTRITLAFCRPTSLVATTGGLYFGKRRRTPLTLSKPIAFTESGIVRLAPAIEEAHAAVWPDSDGNLLIWGILDVGSTDFSILQREGASRERMAPCFLLTIEGPGSVTALYGPDPLATVRAGTLKQPGFRGLATPILTDISRINAELQEEAVADQRVHGVDLPHSEMLGSWSVDVVLTKLLMSIKALAHGGALLFVPDEWLSDRSSVTKALNIKYGVADADLWPLLKEHYAWTARRYDPGANKEETDLAEKTLRETLELIEDRIRLFSLLSAVDGAVVMTQRLRLVGFGAEVVCAVDTSVTEVMERSAPSMNDRVSINSFGTRTRSAIRFCWAAEGAIAFVVSQDGDLRIFRRFRNNVEMWSDALSR